MSTAARTLLLFCAGAVAAAAACPPRHGARTTIGAAGEQLCAKHREPLQAVTVYGPGDGACVLVQQTKTARAARACSPNALPFAISRTRNALYSRAVAASYCKRCEAEVQAHAR
jgi:hypothetical protein